MSAADHEDTRALDVIDFWIGAGPGAWFSTDEGFDAACRRWLPLVEDAAAGDLDHLAATAAGCLALVLLLDQFPRNVFRDTPRAFATDDAALAVAEHALARGYDRAFAMPMRNFLCLPFMHAEDLAVQDRSLDLYRAIGDRETLLHAFVHHDAIRRFGRFPHRNRVLGRTSTPEEEAWLAAGGLAV